MTTNPITFTLVIVAVTCLISLVLMQNRTGKAMLIFHPVTISKHHQWYRFVTSGFIHADMVHLAINMFVLWSFGTVLETYFYPAALGAYSGVKFLILYFGGIVISSIPSYFRHRNDQTYSALGASGGVAAVVFAVIMFAPWDNLYLYGVIAIPQILAGAAYLLYSWYKDRNPSDNIGHMAHFTGALWGFLFTGFMNPGLFMFFVQRTLEGPNW